MKHRINIKRYLSCLLALVLLAGALPLPAAAEEAVQVSALSALTEALNAGGQRIVLTATIEIDQDTTMDLRGSSIETADGVTTAIRLRNGKLVVSDSVGGGKLTAWSTKSAAATAISVSNGVMEVHSGEVSAAAPSKECKDACAIRVEADYPVHSGTPVTITGGTVSASSGDNPCAIRYEKASDAGLVVADATVRAVNPWGNKATAVYLEGNDLSVVGGKLIAQPKAGSPRYPYAIYRAAGRYSFNVRGDDARIDGVLYLRGGVDRREGGMFGGEYSAQPNYAYIHSGCKVTGCEDAPYFWKVTGAPPQNYTISFDANGGEGSMPGVLADIGKDCALPRCTITRSGYRFVGWAKTSGGEAAFADGGTVRDLTTVAGGSITLYAVWQEVKYHVTWYDNDGVTVLKTEEVRQGTYPTYGMEEPARLGAVFRGWAMDKERESGVPEGELPAVTADVSYYAAFSAFAPEYYTLIWRSYDGSAVLAQASVAANSKAVYEGEPPAWEQTGYHDIQFKGWNTSARQSAGVDLPLVTADVTYFAAFSMTANTYAVRFDPNGGTGTMADQGFTYDEAQALTANAFTRAHYHFLGWAETEDGTVRYADGASVKNLTAEQGKTLTLYAVWAPDPYTVIWYDNTGTTVLYTDPKALYGTQPVYAGEVPFAAGGVFAGWATEPGKSAGVPAAELPVVTGDAAYYAAFRPFVTEYYTVTWMDYEGKTLLETRSYAANAKAVYPGATATSRTRTGYACVFKGWNTQPLQSVGQDLPPVTQNATYYAAFADTANTYAVRFDPNGGTGTMTDQSFTYDETQALTANAFTKAHYHFLGWAESAGGAKKYDDGETVKNLAAAQGAVVTLYAAWELDTHTVTWYDGDAVLESGAVAFGSAPQ